MKSISRILLMALMFTLATTLVAQETTDKEAKRAARAEYSRWSIGGNIGLPFTSGDMSSFAHNKTYFGVIGGLQATYQLSPIFGLTLNGEYGENKAGNKLWENDFILNPNGWIHIGAMPSAPAGSKYFTELYTNERYAIAGLHLDINLMNLFAGNRANPGRFAIIASPGIYAQKFSPTVHTLADDKQFASKLKNSVGLGLGGNLSFRYRASKLIDLQLKTNMQWIENQNFDGIVNTAERAVNSPRYTWMTSAMVGVVFKIGNKSKKENLIWSTNRYDRPTPPPAPQAVKEEPMTVIEQAQPIAQTPAPAPVVEKTVMPQTPAVHFKRDQTTIDREKYKNELAEILSILNRYPDAKFRIEGYADHAGSTSINDRVSKARAEALKAYLLENGISAARIVSAEGCGIDKSLSGNDAYSVKARRAVVVNFEN